MIKSYLNNYKSLNQNLDEFNKEHLKLKDEISQKKVNLSDISDEGKIASIKLDIKDIENKMNIKKAEIEEITKEKKYYILCLAFAYYKGKKENTFLKNFKDFLELMVNKNEAEDGKIFMSISLKEIFNYGQAKSGGNTYLKYLHYLYLAKKVNDILKLENEQLITEEISNIESEINKINEINLTNITEVKETVLYDHVRRNRTKIEKEFESQIKQIISKILNTKITLDKNLDEYRIEKNKTDISIKEFINLLNTLEDLKKIINLKPNPNTNLNKIIEQINERIKIEESEIREILDNLPPEIAILEERIKKQKPKQKPKQSGGKYHKLSKKKISNKRQKNMRINKRGKTMRNKQNKTLRKKSKISKKNKTHKNSRNNNSSKNSKKK